MQRAKTAMAAVRLSGRNDVGLKLFRPRPPDAAGLPCVARAEAAVVRPRLAQAQGAIRPVVYHVCVVLVVTGVAPGAHRTGLEAAALAQRPAAAARAAMQALGLLLFRLAREFDDFALV